MKNRYAQVWWTVDDIRDRRPNWTIKQCAKWLNDNEETLMQMMTQKVTEYLDFDLADEPEEKQYGYQRKSTRISNGKTPLADCGASFRRIYLDTLMMKFIREIGEAKVVQKEINDLEQFGFTLVWTADSVQVYAEVEDTRLHFNDERKAA